MTLFELVINLTNIPSTSGQEREIADYLSHYLRAQDFQVRKQKISENRYNILANAGKRLKVILCTHIDTVPLFFPASEDETYIYGRGCCDAKGILAAMIFAAIELKKIGSSDFGLLFVVGEEADSIGARKANDLDTGCEYIIIGEPTENKLARGHKGLVALKLTTEGKSAHSSLPHLGDSAIEKLLPALQTIGKLDFGESDLGKTITNIGTIEGGVAHNVIADSASSQISIRSGHPSEDIITKLLATIEENVSVEIITRSEPQRTFTFPESEGVVMPYATDIPHLQNFGQHLLVGPGSIEVAHTDEERIEKKQLMEAVVLYQNLVERLLLNPKSQ